MAASTGRPFVNFGDEITPLALAMASGRRVTWAPTAQAEVLAVGSILEFFVDHDGRNDVLVWGAGLRAQPGSTERASAIRSGAGSFLAVRGPLTRASLGLPDSTVTADPGVLVSRLVTRPARRRGTGFLPHFRSWATLDGRRALARARAEGVSIITPSDTVPRVLEQVAALDFLYTSSLHGLVAAHALGVPVQWVAIPGIESWVEPDFKYRDHLASVGSSMQIARVETVWSRDEATVDTRRDEATGLRDTAEALGARLLEVWK